ncbi:hypothetical protein Cni_G00048 [Canna indica]|uniref:PWWP domain-containing protein n=1 Tax=Canna indica TaxID=4628 RepID=A0AAQ3PZP5_9LILI|nr:hypothetical protein Cni_G00048 [Canna indica]
MGGEQDETLSSSNVSDGGLVWVRRPNGSWWPGRVLRRDELPAKCVIPSRSGTPIKLLGREDGSMDWYNLAKSTRVKAFRCGEFDECIEKAVAAPARSKKSSTSTGKYIRREDAILHALEIEKGYFLAGKQNGSVMDDCFRRMAYDFSRKSKKMYELDKQPGYITKKVDTVQDNAAQELSQSLVSYERTNKLIASDNKLMEKKKRKTPNDSEDHEGTKRMRDLQDIGLRAAPNRKSNVHADTGWSTELALPDSASLSESNIYNGFSGLRTKRSKDSCSSLKRKRSQIAKIHERPRKKNHRHAPSKDCGGTKVIVPSYCRWDGSVGGQPSDHGAGAAANKLKESLSTSRTDISCDIIISPHCSGTSSETLLNTSDSTPGIDRANFESEVKDCELASMLEFIDNDCPDDLINIPLIMGDNIRDDLSIMFEHFPTSDLEPDAAEKQHNICSQGDLASYFNEGLGESSFAGSARKFNNIRKKTEKRNLEQHLKGKKNINNERFGKDANSGSSIDGADQSDCSLKDKIEEERIFGGLDCKIDGNCFGESLTSDAIGQLLKDDSVSEVHDIPQSQITDLPPSEHGQSHSEVVKDLSAHLREQDTSSKIHMPVSTMPTQQLFPHDKVSLSTFSNSKVLKQLKFTTLGSSLLDVELTVKSSYRGPHVPLISLTSRLNRKEVVGHPVHVEAVKDGLTDTLLTRKICQSLKNRGNFIAKSPYGRNRGGRNNVTTKRKYSRNRNSRLSPRKIRRLSSINVDTKEKEVRKPVVEEIAGPVVACVPLRLVFSRIAEALSSSARLTSIS